MKNTKNVALSIEITFFLCMMLCSGFLIRYYTFDNYFLSHLIEI